MAGEVVALRAVGAEQLATLGEVGVLAVDLLVGRDGRAGAERGDVRREGRDLGLGVDRLLARSLVGGRGERHAAGA